MQGLIEQWRQLADDLEYDAKVSIDRAVILADMTHAKRLRVCADELDTALRACAEALAPPEPPRERELLRRFVEKLDVILPKVDGIIAFNTVRSGHQFYDGPNLIDEMRDAKALLAAPPRAEAREARPQGVADGQATT